MGVVTPAGPDEVADLRCGRGTRRILLLNVVAQVGLVVTGGLVRLTGSGLGCPTWPECTSGSFVPLANQPQGFHRFIEFGNRSLTGVLVVIAAAALLAVTRGWWGRAIGRPGPRVRPPLVWLTVGVVLGIVGQAVLGGLTVLYGLNPWFVATHFLLSMAIIAASYLALARSGERSDGRVVFTVRAELRLVSCGIVALAGVVLVLGTVVTGSGPHSGDPDAVVRFALDPRMVAWLHADVVIAFTGLVVAFWLGARLTDAPRSAQRNALVLLALCALQGTIGYTQYFTGLPVPLVSLHMLGACLVWIAAWSVLVATRTRDLLPAGMAT